MKCNENKTEGYLVLICFVFFVDAQFEPCGFFFKAEDLNLEFSYIDANFTNTTGGLNAVRTSAWNSLWWAAGLKWWEFLQKSSMWNDGPIMRTELPKSSLPKVLELLHLLFQDCEKTAVLPCGDHGIVSYRSTEYHHVTMSKVPNKVCHTTWPGYCRSDLFLWLIPFLIQGICHPFSAKKRPGGSSFIMFMISRLCSTDFTGLFFDGPPLRSMDRPMFCFEIVGGKHVISGASLGSSRICPGTAGIQGATGHPWHRWPMQSQWTQLSQAQAYAVQKSLVRKLSG